MQKGLLSDPFKAELANKTYLVNWQSGDTTHYGVIDSSANMVIRLFESTEKSITPSISLDKKLIFLSFSTAASSEQPVAPHEWLVWGAVDGPLTHTFDPGFEKLSGYWSKDNRTLLYLGEKAKAWEVGTIDSVSGNRRVFFTEAPDLKALYVPSKNSEVPFGDVVLLLKQADGTSRLFVYDQGRALNYYFDRADLQQVERSPVDDTIFAEFGKEPDESLYLARPDELSRPALREHLLKAYSWAGWSPDGRLLAFTQFDQGEERTLEIVDAGGVLIRRYYPLHESVYFIADEWNPCTEN